MMIEHDLLGVGIGPFNLGLAALLSRHPERSAVFLERKPEFRWHSGMILPGTTLQVPFLADLVTLVDPTHPLSFLNYLADHDRLYKFYFYEHFHIPREEYDHYCRWASTRLTSCRFGETVRDVAHDPATERFVVTSERPDGSSRSRVARNIALGVGTEPVMPAALQGHDPTRVFHTSEFGYRRARLKNRRRVAVVGSGQSAAECVLALLSDLSPQDVAEGAAIHWITRSDGFFPMEYSKLGLEHFTPDFLRHFHRIDPGKRRSIVAGQGLLYKGISASTIAAIFDLLYGRSVGGRATGLQLVSSCEVLGVDGGTTADAPFAMTVRHGRLETRTRLDLDAVIAGTGYRHRWPDWLERMKGELLATDEHGDLAIGEDFRAARQGKGAGNVFVQNAETFHHGVGAPDLGLGAHRNAVIVNALLGRKHYRVDADAAFQTFGLPSRSPSHLIERDPHALAS